LDFFWEISTHQMYLYACRSLPGEWNLSISILCHSDRTSVMTSDSPESQFCGSSRSSLASVSLFFCFFFFWILFSLGLPHWRK
jgi:hypothetical protein